MAPKKKKIESGAGEAMPIAPVASSIEEVFGRMAKGRDYAGALALAPTLGERRLGELAPAMLSDLGGWASWGSSYAAYSADPKSNGNQALGWGDILMRWGADPFAHEGAPGSGDCKKSYFESLIEGGFIAYASSLALAGQGSKAKALAALERINAGRLGQWSLGSGATQREPSTHMQEKLIEKGAAALDLAFAVGVSPDSKANGDPWAFSCPDADCLRAFVKGGFDATVKNRRGQTLSEAFASRDLVRVRQEMQDLARAAQAAASDKPDAESAQREAIALARKGSWREVERAAKGGGLDPLALKDADGAPLLAVALAKGNWGLALDALKAGADPRALCGKPPLPVALGAIVIEYPYGSGRGKSSSAAKADECLDLLIGSIDFAWRDQGGRAPLEACLAHQPHARVSLQAMKLWCAAEPIDPERPLWARLAALRQDPWMVGHCAQLRPDEPWMAFGKSLMGHLLVSKLPTGYHSRDDAWRHENGLASFMESVGRGPGGQERLAAICAPEQWEAAFSEFWRQSSAQGAGSNDDYQDRELVERMAKAIGEWADCAKKWEIDDPFDFARMGRSLVAGWDIRPDGSRALRAGPAIEKLATLLCVKFPDRAGVVLLDVLAAQTESSAKVGHAIWRRALEAGAQVSLPDAHPIFEKAGGLAPELANHPIWREIEELVVAKAASSARKIRL